MASVTYQNVTKSFGDVPVINGIDLHINDGELVVFVGPSGCGKSTLLRMLAGLEDVTGGDILIGENKVNDMAAKKRNIAMVFQNYALYPHMTVADNMDFGLRLRGATKTERTQAVKKAAAILGIEELLERQPRALSGGQRQRVAMGRAIVRDPAVFLMDEPLSNLDAKLRTQMRVEIRKLQQRLGTTMIFVTHDQVEAMTLADRIAVLDGGYVQQFGKPGELYHSPCNKFVAGFLGSPAINFINCSIGAANELAMPDGQKISIPPERSKSLEGTASIDVGIRPEEITIVENDKTTLDDGLKESITWQSKVTLVESLGGEILVYVKIGDHDITVKVPDRENVEQGSVVSLSFNMAAAHMFSANDGKLLSLGSRT